MPTIVVTSRFLFGPDPGGGTETRFSYAALETPEEAESDEAARPYPHREPDDDRFARPRREIDHHHHRPHTLETGHHHRPFDLTAAAHHHRPFDREAGTARTTPGKGGSRSWRNNNPGNIEYGPFAKAHGAIGTDGRFAIFPSETAGINAQRALLFESPAYKNLTLPQAIARWAPGSENDVPAYVAAMGGDASGRKMRDYSPAEQDKLLASMRTHEGWREGRGREEPPVLGGASPGADGKGNPADFAESMANLHDHDPTGHAKIMQFLRTGAHGMDPATTDWCASFVGSALHHAGYRDIPQVRGGDVATAYENWGVPVAAKDVRRGDVVVTTRGLRPGAMGGHVSIATGPMSEGQIPVIEGDTRASDWRRGHPRHRVARDWETDRPGLMYRRAVPPDEAVAEGD